MNSSKIEIRQGWPSDLGEISAFLDENLMYDKLSVSLLEEKLTGDPYPDSDLCFTAYTYGELSGFLYCVRRMINGRNTGYVKIMAVEKKLRRQGIATHLYQSAENMLVDKGAQSIKMGDAPLNYFMPGIDPRYTPALCFAEKQGFKKTGEAVNMLVNLNARDWSTSREEENLKSAGIEIRRARYDEMPAIEDLLSNDWKLWRYEVKMAMRDNPPSVHVALKDERILAFSIHNGNNKGTGWFGPMGTHTEMRGYGIGSILLKRCLFDMQKQGYPFAVIPWVGPIAFYSHYAGAVINRVFWRMEKLIDHAY